MSTNSKIQWTEATWNPVRGCSLVSAGCQNCYAMKTAHRFSEPGQPYEGLTEVGPHGPRWNGKIKLVHKLLEAPLHWKKPRRIFVNSMTDLFHEDVPDEFIAEVFAIMARCQQHTFQILTKRPSRMLSFCSNESHWWGNKADIARTSYYGKPLPNVWLGISCEDQQAADARIPLLLQTPAAVRWISAEPLLGPMDLSQFLPFNTESSYRAARMAAKQLPNLDWVVCGGESGPGARPCDIAWIRSLYEQCQAANVPVFIKQGGASNRCQHDSKGGCWDCMPLDLKIREYPHA